MYKRFIDVTFLRKGNIGTMNIDKKKAVIISCFDWYEKRLEAIKDVLEEEYSVIIVTSDFDHISKKKINKNNFFEYINVPKYKKNVSLMRIISHLIFGCKVGGVLKKTKPDLIYLLLPPNNTAEICRRYVEKNKINYFVDVIDMWPESMPVNCNKDSMLFNKWKSMRNKSLIIADHIFVECNLYYKSICNLINDKGKISLLYLYKKSFNIKQNSVKNRCKRKNVILLGYVGSINNIIDIEEIYKIIKMIKDCGKKVEIRIIGDGESRERFIKGLEKLDIDISYYGMVFDELKKYEILCECDYGLNIMKKDITVGLTIKSIDYFSIGLPIINNIRGDTWEIVENRVIGVNYDGNKANFLKGINKDYSRDKVLNCYEELFSVEAFKSNVKEHIFLE